MILQPPAGLRAGPGPGVLRAGWRVALRRGEVVAVLDLGEANSGTEGVWARPLRHGLGPSQSG